MKRIYLAGACLAFGTGCVFAQSSVTLYGVTDLSVQYLTHANRTGDSLVRMTTGGLSQSLLGLRGFEDLGGGYKAVFRMESLFDANTGQQDSPNNFWTVSYLGVTSPTYGTVTLGRQVSAIADIVTRTYASNSWAPYVYVFRPEVTFFAGTWSSNMAKYQLRAGNILGEATYAFGNSVGSTSYGSQLTAGIAYLGGAFGAGAAYSDARDSTNGSHSKAWTAGASYTWQSTQVHLGYFENRLDPNFHTFLNGYFTPQILAALKFTDMSSRTMFSAGITQYVGASTHLAFNYWRTLQTGKTRALNGTASQFQLVADYNLSKRTDVYVETNYALYRGDLIGAQLQGVNALSSAQKGTQLGLMAGIRHQF
ncbi:porin (plasmid) [Paraburkholderia sp. D15]|uniref:porin n=1 Tax=Paraburkholderia sp. D15 TaxID=2880218 RepID=UPI002478B625|nr:porin [Paraburkholderia sp. D15]WGS55272.1 porin [Paraburkholderia sp. D15]